MTHPPAPDHTPADAQGVRWYLGTVAAFMIPSGIQMVLLPYLLAIELRQAPERFGATLMLGQLPLLLFLLPGGWLADRIDARRLLIGLHAIAIIMPLVLAVVLWRGQLNEPILMLYALAWGLVSAFVVPARDGLVKRVAGERIQRLVVLVVGMQFGMMLLGQGLGGMAAHWGSISILLVQCAVLATGIYTASRLAPASSSKVVTEVTGPRSSLWRELGGGVSLIFTDPPMRASFLLTVGMGVFFGGTFLVLIPLTLRDLYAGGAPDIALGFIMFGLGTVTSITALTRRGDMQRPGRALVLGMLLGCCCLTPMVLAPPQWLYYGCIFLWGMCGGVTMSMSRTILQERAPASHQSRVMAAHSLASAGSGPLGSLITGLAVGAVGARWAVLLPLLGVLTTVASVLATHSIWALRTQRRQGIRAS